MKIVERYILRRTLSIAVIALVWTLAIVWTVQVLGRINVVTDSGQSALTFLHLATLLMSSIIPVILPFAVLIAVAQTLTVMNNDSELVVISAAGTPRRATIRPILIVAVGACLLSFFVQNVIDPQARIGVRTLLAKASADLLSSVVQEGSFRRVQKGLFVQVGERLPDGRLGRIFVADSRQKNVDLAYYAKEGVVTDTNDRGLLIMTDGVVHRHTPTGEVSVIRFDSYTLDLSAFASARAYLVIGAGDRGVFYLADPDPEDPLFKQNPQEFRAFFHIRLTEWIYPLVFGLLAFAVAGDARSHREARIPPLGAALAMALVVRWLGYYVGNEAESKEAFIPLLYAVPLVSMSISTWFISTNRTLELPVHWLDRINALVTGAGDRLTVFRLRLLGASRVAGGSR